MYGYDLVALIFVREISDDWTRVVKTLDRKLDETMTRQKRQDKLGVFVILCTDDDKMQAKMKELTEKEGLKQVVLSTFKGVNGPPRYRVAREAAYTVAVYKDHHDVSANFALRKGELDEGWSAKIVAAIAAELPQ